MNPTAAAVAVLLLAGGPSPDRSTDWRDYRDAYLNQNVHLLMKACSQGEQLNALGRSYWDDGFIQRVEADLHRAGHSLAEIDAINAGKAAAMKQACPDVW